ncbi:DUF5947 family protein [Streptomyces sp. NPDC059894]|uniref:DUF5947 family protein n=1 Tax=unclassified Streptomyces TaxID=2593676 RepID=UPI00364F13F9
MNGLRRVARQAARADGRDAVERCDLCAQPLPPGYPHRHVLRPATGTVSCACPACAVLFDHDAGSAGGHRLLPRERRRLDGCRIDDAAWACLGVPVSLAFFTRSGESGEVTAAYPSPLGVLRAPVPPDSWRDVETCHPDLPEHVTDVQALLVDRGHGASEHWLVPLDDCYRLAAVVRAHWKGLDGGPEVWQRVEDFFRALADPTDPTPFTPQEASWASP